MKRPAGAREPALPEPHQQTPRDASGGAEFSFTVPVYTPWDGDGRPWLDIERERER